nr:MAG TPA: hypothetical protein [Caudoviricetes sp.]
MNQILGTMALFRYREDPKNNPNRTFDVVRPVTGTNAENIKHNISYYAMKTGAIHATSLTKEQYEEMVNEATKQSTPSTTTKEEN